MKYVIDGSSIKVYDIGRVDLESTLQCGQCFRFEQKDGVFSGVVGKTVIKVSEQENSLVFHEMSEDDFLQIAVPFFDLETDYEEIINLLSSDQVMAEVCSKSGGLRLLKQEPWEALVSFIISQNNNIKRIKKIISSLCASFGEDLGGGYFAFPEPEVLASLSCEELAHLKMGFRDRYVLDAARKVASGETDLYEIMEMSFEEAEAELMKICGVGKKVADCVLLYGFGFLSAFPVDVWMKRAMEMFYPCGLPECFKGYEGFAQLFLFDYIRKNQTDMK